MACNCRSKPNVRKEAAYHRAVQSVVAPNTAVGPSAPPAAPSARPSPAHERVERGVRGAPTIGHTGRR
jgi:hypothetical protein